MRGMGKALNGAVLSAALLGFCTTAFAQADPKIVVTFDNASVQTATGTVKLTQVTLSRDQLVTFAAYDLVIKNNSTNPLNRLYFKADVTNNGSDNGAFDDYFSSLTFDCGAFGLATLNCTSSNSIASGGEFKVTIVVKAPTTGTQLTVKIAAGGYEGNSQTGQGCCATNRTATTVLIDSTTDTTFTYTLNAITFVKGNTGGRIFTGNQAVASTADPFTTDVTAAQFSALYDIGSIQEASVPVSVSLDCKNGNRFKTCYKTTISLPNVSYATPTDLPAFCSANLGLSSVLRIDASLIKGNPTPDLNRIRVFHTPDPTPAEPAPGKVEVLNCDVAIALPCICKRYQYIKNTTGGLLPFSNDVKNDIELVIKGDKNGLLEFF